MADDSTISLDFGSAFPANPDELSKLKKGEAKAKPETAKLGVPSGSIMGGPGPVARTLEMAGQMPAVGLGMAAGGALGSAAGPVGTAAGSIAGGTGAASVYDNVIAQLNHKLYGTLLPQDMGAAQTRNLEANAVGTTAGYALGGMLGKAVTGDVAGGATEAAEKQGAENLGQRADLYEALEGDQPIGQRGMAGEIQDETIQRLEKGAENIKGAGEKASQEAVQSPMGQEALEQEKKNVVAEATGQPQAATRASLEAPPEVTPEGINLPSPELIERRRGLADAAFGSEKKMQGALSKQYDQHYGPFLEHDINTSLRNEAQAQREWLKDKNLTRDVSPKINALISEAEHMGIVDDGTMDKAREIMGIGRADWKAMPWDQQLANLQKASGIAQRMGPEFADVAKMDATKATSKVKEILGFRSRASALMASEPDSVNKAVAADLVEEAELSLKESGIPGAQELNSKYRAFKTIFNNKFYRNIATAKDPIDAAPGIFNDRNVGPLMYANADPDGQAYLRRLYGDWVNDKGSKVVDISQQGPTLRAMFPGTKLANPSTWIHLPDRLVNASDVIGSRAGIAQGIEDKINKAAADEALSASKDISDTVMKGLPDLAKQGQVGRQRAQEIAQAIQAAPPLEKGNVALQQFYNKSTPQLIKELASSQMTPDVAGVGALQSGQLAAGATKGYGVRMLQSIKNRVLLYGGVSAMGLLTSGHASPFMEAATAIGGVAMGKDALQDGLQYALGRSPDFAAAFYEAIGNPGSALNQQVIARGMMGSIINTGITKVAGIGNLEDAEPAPTVGSIADSPAVKTKAGSVRAGDAGDSHDDIERRIGEKGERGFIDKKGEYISRDDAHSALKAIGGEDRAPHSSDLAPNPTAPEGKPEPVSLGDSPMRKMASAELNKNPKAVAMRDYEDAARQYRKGDIGAMDPKEWVKKGLTPQDLAQGWKRSAMSRVQAGLSQLSVPQLTKAWQLADDSKDEADLKSVKVALSDKLSHGGWQSLPDKDKGQIASILRQIYAPRRDGETTTRTDV